MSRWEQLASLIQNDFHRLARRELEPRLLGHYLPRVTSAVHVPFFLLTSSRVVAEST